MKKLILMSALVLGGLGITAADAQIGVSINLHLGSRPVYVPARPVEVVPSPVYDDYYYYLPEVEAYYSVGERCYYYMDGSRWISAAYLPGRYHNYDWRTARRYEIHTSRPYMHHDVYRGKYGGYNNPYTSKGYGDRDRVDHNRYNNSWGNNDRNNNYDRHNNGYNNGGYNNHQGGYDKGHESSRPSDSRGNSRQPANSNGHGHSSFGGSQHFAQNMSRPGRS